MGEQCIGQRDVLTSRPVVVDSPGRLLDRIRLTVDDPQFSSQAQTDLHLFRFVTRLGLRQSGFIELDRFFVASSSCRRFGSYRCVFRYQSRLVGLQGMVGDSSMIGWIVLEEQGDHLDVKRVSRCGRNRILHG